MSSNQVDISVFPLHPKVGFARWYLSLIFDLHCAGWWDVTQKGCFHIDALKVKRRNRAQTPALHVCCLQFYFLSSSLMCQIFVSLSVFVCLFVIDVFHFCLTVYQKSRIAPLELQKYLPSLRWSPAAPPNICFSAPSCFLDVKCYFLYRCWPVCLFVFVKPPGWWTGSQVSSHSQPSPCRFCLSSC